jgi:hypothetical protein
VYELPPALNAWQDMSFVRHNIGWMLWQELLIDEHRTLDPWAADYYFIPVFPLGTSFGMGTAMAAFEHVISALPYWNATRGLNHLAVASYDFGFCQIAGLAYFKRIRMISHFGLTKAAQPLPWCFGATGGPSYRQNVDMLVPDTMNMDSKRRTPYLRDGDPWAGRNNTFFFSGSRHGDSRNALLDMGIARPGYVIREGGVNIAEEMLRSVFCGDVGPGGFSNRFTLAMALACVPVFLDEHLPAWTDGLNVDEFAVRLDSLQNLTRTLDAVTPHRLLSLREAGRDVWRLFVWPFLMDVGEHNALSMFFRRLAQLAA